MGLVPAMVAYWQTLCYAGASLLTKTKKCARITVASVCIGPIGAARKEVSVRGHILILIITLKKVQFQGRFKPK